MSGLALQTANVSHFYDIFYLLMQLHTIFLKGTAWFFPLEISHKNHKIYLDCSIGAPYSEWSIISWFWSAAVNLCWLPLCTYNQEKSAAARSIKPWGTTGRLFFGLMALPILSLSTWLITPAYFAAATLTNHQRILGCWVAHIFRQHWDKERM